MCVYHARAHVTSAAHKKTKKKKKRVCVFVCTGKFGLSVKVITSRRCRVASALLTVSHFVPAKTRISRRLDVACVMGARSSESERFCVGHSRCLHRYLYARPRIPYRISIYRTVRISNARRVYPPYFFILFIYFRALRCLLCRACLHAAYRCTLHLPLDRGPLSGRIIMNSRKQYELEH